MAKKPKQGQEEAHTLDLDAALGSVDALARELQAGGASVPSPDDDGQLDTGGRDLFSLAAEQVASERRARGRPTASPNRRNAAMFDYLGKIGHRHPAVTLSQIQTADTLALAAALGAKPLEVAKLQASAAAALLPFDLAKKVHVDAPTDRRLPVMVIGEMNVMMERSDGTMSAGEKPNEINGDFMRQPSDVPYEEE
ncbi:hypothetical protein JYU29_05015 [Tianweitania sp. BSSL-BM11]|uniref:Terminase small subunit n=1 Tax=Tianweitania aestuarii TaxID=2814886 RepID=A0ABS5RSM9_9HYPH|nr:hypothetical protein [Tianweitania aestuarii]MBS9720048.1 hypothetical protein [Tianweitania aestuarii]